MDRVKELEQSLLDLLNIIDSKEARTEALMAWNHGIRCSEEVSIKNGNTIERAYKLLGLERPKQ